MGGLFLKFKARTKEELIKRVNITISNAERQGMLDIRGIKYFPPFTYTHDDGIVEKQWIVFLSIHS